MYNEDRKVRFIKEREEEVILPEGFLERHLNRVSEMENRLGKDLCDFTFYDITEYYKMLNLSSFESISVLNSQFSMYTFWCLEQNLVKDGQNHFQELNTNDFYNCINKVIATAKIITRGVVLEWIEQLPNPKDQFILLGLFEGIKGKDFCELIKLRPEDVNGNVLSLCTGRKIEVSNKLISIIEDCKEENKYYSITGNNVKVSRLVNRGYIIKDYPNIKEDVSAFQDGRRIYNNIKRILCYFGVYPLMTANTIAESGKIHEIKKRAKELNINCNDFVYSEHIQEIEQKYDCKIQKKSFMLKYQGYLAS